MNRKLVYTLILFSVVFTSFIFYSAFPTGTNRIESESTMLPPSPGDPADEFLYGAIQTITLHSDYTNYDLLGFNLWHAYTGSEQASSQMMQIDGLR